MFSKLLSFFKSTKMKIGLGLVVGSAMILLHFFYTTVETAISQEQPTKGKLDFLDPNHDFGTFNEGDIVKHRFEFMNVGSETVSITSVRASCGCTTPAYSKDPIKPNGSGYIDVEYNSIARPGHFNKKVFVENTGNPSMVVLSIEGTANPAPLVGKDLSTQGDFLISEGVIDIGNLKAEEIFRHVVKLQNTSSNPIKIVSHEVDADIRLSYPPYSILPGEKVSVSILLAPKDRIAGKLESKIILKTNDPKQSDKVIQLRGMIVGTKKASLESPEIKFNKTYIDLGEVLQHEKVPVAFGFKNVGKSDLVISDVIPSCGCTVVSLSKGTFKVGATDSIKVVLDTEDKFGVIRKEITVKTNDPANPELMLVLEAKVIEHPDKAIMAEMRAKAGKNASIFEGECRSCHVDRGVNKFGAALYAASCQMCHGELGKNDGKHHPGTIFTKEWLKATPSAIVEERIAQGALDEKKKGMMPGFQTNFGGPLTKEQVASLVAYMKNNQKN